MSPMGCASGIRAPNSHTRLAEHVRSRGSLPHLLKVPNLLQSRMLRLPSQRPLSPAASDRKFPRKKPERYLFSPECREGFYSSEDQAGFPASRKPESAPDPSREVFPSKR